MRAVRFGRHELRPQERQLLVDGVAAPLGARAFDVLQALVERRDRVVSKDELLELVWPGLVVEENNLQVQVSTLRKLLGAQSIATVPGRGYRFALALDVVANELEPSAAEPCTGPTPTAAPALVGREDDLAALEASVQSNRLVTIVGAGGIGKTRLAQALAARLRSHFRDGVWIAELAPLSDPALLPAAVAQALGASLPGRKPALEELVDVLAGREVLLVLDNCEHVVEAAGTFAATVLAREPDVRLLATSQELLRVPHEHLFHATPLALPDAPGLDAALAAGAVRLFVERVVALQPRFALTTENLADVAEICRRLDGLPLAIELAAARVPLLGVAGLRERLDQRLRVLTAGSRTVLRRHQALRELLDWSHGLLGDDDRVVFRRIGVFSGSFSLEAAQHALADERIDGWAVLDHVGTLVDKSLLMVEPSDPPRYRMLESARAYALEKLREAGETEVTLRRHAEAIVAQFDSWHEARWKEPMLVRAARALPDVDNVRGALAWAEQAGERILLVALAGSSWGIWDAAGLESEGMRRCKAALAVVDAETPPALEARLQLARSRLARPRYEAGERAALARAVELFRQLGDGQGLFFALAQLASDNALAGDFDVPAGAVAEMERILDPQWPPALRWWLHVARVWMCAYQHRIEEAVAEFEPARRLAEAAGDDMQIMSVLMWTEQTAQYKGQTQEALELGRRFESMTRRMPFSNIRRLATCNLATVLVELGKIEEALPLLRETTPLAIRTGRLWMQIDVLALLALRLHRYEDAARLLGRADAAHVWRNGRRELGEQRLPGLVLAGLREQFDDERIDALKAEGAKLSDEEAARVALNDEVLARSAPGA